MYFQVYIQVILLFLYVSLFVCRGVLKSVSRLLAAIHVRVGNLDIGGFNAIWFPRTDSFAVVQAPVSWAVG